MACLEGKLQPQDLVYVYYFAVSPFKYYYHGPSPGICWGRSCVEKGLDPAAKASTPPQRLWLIASHIPELKFLRQFAASLLGPDWREADCFTREGAALLRFDRRPRPRPLQPRPVPQHRLDPALQFRHPVRFINQAQGAFLLELGHFPG